jgi:YihY family inner membrane protein
VAVDPLRPLRAFDRVQQRHRWLAIPVAVVKKFGDDRAGAQAALLAYYAFFSLFPLLLVFVTILGYILAGDAGAQKTVENTVLGHFPGIGPQIKERELEGHGAALAIGIALSLWAGLGITQAAQNAFNNVWAVPLKDRPDYLRARLRGLLVVIVLGVLFLVSSIASGLVAGGLGGTPLKVAGFALSLGINFVLFAAAFRLLTVASIPTRSMWIGAVVGGVLWELLQVLGGVYVSHVITRSSSTYGIFATVIGVLIWLRLGAQATLYAAEINVVVVRRLWPRSLFEPKLPTDQRALTALAKVEQRSEGEEIEVHFRE